jgi:hypothetical protein
LFAKSTLRSRFVFPPVTEWKGFAIAAFCGLVAVACLQFISSSSKLAAGPRALTSVLYSVEVVAAALLCGTVIWACIKVVRGQLAPEPKESVLWFASIAVVLVTASRMF